MAASFQGQMQADQEAAAFLAMFYDCADHPNLRALFLAFSREADRDSDSLPRWGKSTDGADLCEMVHTSLVTETLARAATADVLSAIAFLHKQHIVHRNVKSENVWLSVDGRAVLTGSEHATRLSSRGCLVGRIGTPGYIAPEVILGREHGEKVDSFGMGVTIFFALVGTLPFDGSTADRLRNTLRNRVDFDKVQSCARNEESRHLIRRLLASNAHERASAADALHHNWICCDWSGGIGQMIAEGKGLEACFKIKDKEATKVSTTQSTLEPLSCTTLPVLSVDALPSLYFSEDEDAELDKPGQTEAQS